MLTVRKELLQLLKQETGLEVYFLQPPINVGISLPILILEETSNSDYYYSYDEDTDIVEKEITDVSYSISIYASKPHNLYEHMPVIDKLMKRCGFNKSSVSGDLVLDGIYCKTMTFTGKLEQLENGDILIYKR